MKYILTHKTLFLWSINSNAPTFTNSFIMAKSYNKQKAKEIAKKFNLIIKKTV